jgi:hypothetical protein
VTDPVRAALTTCSDCGMNGSTRTYYMMEKEKRLCRHCWNSLRAFLIKFGSMEVIPEWTKPENNYDPHKGEPGTR